MAINAKVTLTLISSLFLSAQLYAATVTVKGGHTYTGEIESQDSKQIVIDSNGIKMTIPLTDVTAIDLSGPKATAPQPTKQAAPVAGIATVDAGTSLAVKITTGFNSHSGSTGQRFTGVLEGNLVSGSTLVAPKGSLVYGVLTEVKAARRIAGHASLQFELTEISLNGTMQPLKTQSLSGEGVNAARDTVGRTARAAAIGGLIDGSEGARTGAKVGVGVSLLKRGEDIAIPAGDIVDFTLTAPFTPK